MTTTPRIWLTEQAFERLQQELNHLLGLHAVEEDVDLMASAEFDQGRVVSAPQDRAHPADPSDPPPRGGR